MRLPVDLVVSFGLEPGVSQQLGTVSLMMGPYCKDIVNELSVSRSIERSFLKNLAFFLLVRDLLFYSTKVSGNQACMRFTT